jgi:predicted alpha/beta hydrolase family esterase
MKYIILPGYSKKNDDEVLSISQALSMKGLEVYAQRWRHWVDENVVWNVDAEVKLIEESVINDLELTIIAKSLGTHIAVNFIKRNKEKVKNIIFLGIPLINLTDEEKLDYKILWELNIPITVITNNQDPHGDISHVREFLSGLKYTEVEKDDNTHRYNYPNDISSLLLRR